MKKTLLLLALLLPTFAWGQNAPPNKQVRLISLGEVPPWLEAEVSKDGIRVPKPVPPGSIPPADVSAPNGNGNIQATPLNLNVISGVMQFGAKVPGFDLHEGKLAAGAPWLRSPMPATLQSLGVLCRDHKLMSWKNPKMLLLDDGKDVFPAGKIRFVNVSDIEVLVRVGKHTAQRLRPGKTVILPLVEGENTMMVGYPGENETVFLFPRNTINVPGGQRVQAFIYKAQSKKPGKKACFHWCLDKP